MPENLNPETFRSLLRDLHDLDRCPPDEQEALTAHAAAWAARETRLEALEAAVDRVLDAQIPGYGVRPPALRDALKRLAEARK